jgi:hypothetical protein
VKLDGSAIAIFAHTCHFANLTHEGAPVSRG